MNMPAAPLRKKVEHAANQGRAFVYLKRQVEPAVAQQLLQQRIQGVYGQDTYRRFYPAAEVTAQTVGIVNIDGQGQEGLELAYDEYLTGAPGSRQVVKDLYGNIIKQLQVNDIAEPGGDLTLTLDLRLQYLAYRELTAAVNQHRAESGSAVLLDAATGEVLALVSQPSYNPNNRAGLKAENMRNRAVADLIEPGSTIKPFVVAAALMSGDYQPHTKVDTSPGYMRIRNKTIRDHRNYGVLDVTGIITKSSNIGVAKLAQHMGAENLWQFYTKAGIGQANLLGFPGERSEEHTSELQSRPHLVCRLLLEKKKMVGDRGLGRLSASHHGEALIAHAGVSPPLSFARRSGLRLRAASARVCRL